MAIVTIKVVSTKRVNNPSGWDHDEHKLQVSYAGRSGHFKYYTGVAHEGRVHLSDWLQCAAMDVCVAEAGIEDYAYCFGLDVESDGEGFAEIQRSATRAKRLFCDDIADLRGWGEEKSRIDLTISAGESASLDLVDGAHQKQLFTL